ncbi:2-dehydropantoate 2-reductase [Nibrella viscosa]|uniref:2-dehydropantoate 2-reductase n=1 Tax=Nibrella viscosa TaxID=1084524 RepID=A0ABP8KU66_9BACT
MNTVYIVGNGAIGRALAVSLITAGRQVVMLRGSRDDLPARPETIRLETAEETRLEATLPVTSLRAVGRLDGLIVIATKSYANPTVALALNEKGNDSPIVILQNGLGVERAFMEAHNADIYRCVLFATSQPVSDEQVRFRPVAASPIGLVQGQAGGLHTVVEQLHTATFPFRAVADIQPVVWQKTIINSVFNSVCPLLETDNGVFHREERALALATEIIDECVAVAQASGIRLESRAVVDNLLQISRASDGQLISTLQDIRQGRKTEIDTFNQEIVRIARRLQPAYRVTRTQLLGELTELKSELSQKQYVMPPAGGMTISDHTP